MTDSTFTAATRPTLVSTALVADLLSQLASLCPGGDYETSTRIRRHVQAHLAIEASQELRAAGYPARLDVYGDHLIVRVPIAGGAELGIDPMGRCHYATLDECLDDGPDADPSLDPEVWDVVSFDSDGVMRDLEWR